MRVCLEKSSPVLTPAKTELENNFRVSLTSQKNFFKGEKNVLENMKTDCLNLSLSCVCL